MLATSLMPTWPLANRAVWFGQRRPHACRLTYKKRIRRERLKCIQGGSASGTKFLQLARQVCARIAFYIYVYFYFILFLEEYQQSVHIGYIFQVIMTYKLKSLPGLVIEYLD